jgi:hypothetical protein
MEKVPKTRRGERERKRKRKNIHGLTQMIFTDEH